VYFVACFCVALCFIDVVMCVDTELNELGKFRFHRQVSLCVKTHSFMLELDA